MTDITEDDLVEDDFNLDQWKARLAAGKYDGHLIEMASHLAQRAIKDNRRRWKIDWQGQTFTEDSIDLEVAAVAEEFAGMPWGVMNLTMGLDVHNSARIVRAILYGIARVELGMTNMSARQAIKMPATAVLDLFGYYEVDPPGKDGPAP